MMNYEIFKEVVAEKIMSYMPDKYKDMEPRITPVSKVNMTLDGLNLSGGNTNISPTIYINDMYKKYEQSGDLNETLQAASELMVHAFEQIPEVKPQIDFSDAKDKIVFQLINTQQNEQLLSQVPHREFQDLSIIYKMVIKVEAEVCRAQRLQMN